MIHARTDGRRKYELQAMNAARKERVLVLFWARRCRKSTTLGSIAFDDLSKRPGQTVIAASASLLLGTELVNMTVSAVEAAVIVQNEAAAQLDLFKRCALEKELDFQCADAGTGKVYRGLTAKDFTDLYKSKRLEMRLYFDTCASSYSRQLIIAPMPATARGWRGTVLRDEAAFTSVNLEAALREAVDPIFRDVPDLRMIYASNLGRDDRHSFFTMTLPPPDKEFEVKPEGNFYHGENKVLVHRVTLADAYAAGHTLYDNVGQPMSLTAFRGDPANKSQLACNYDLTHIAGGAAAIDLLALLSAQQRGIGTCTYAYIENDAEYQLALLALRKQLGNGPVGVGFDPATTTRETSNPSSLTVTERIGGERFVRLVVVWKERKPQVVRERLQQLFLAIRSREHGGPARRFCLAATSERYFAEETADVLAPLVPTELVIESASVRPAGYDAAVPFKTYLGDLYSTAVNDNRYALPPSDYLRRDQRLTTKNAGRYECKPDGDGAHGDTFVSGALAEYALLALETGHAFTFKPGGEMAAAKRERSCWGV